MRTPLLQDLYHVFKLPSDLIYKHIILDKHTRGRKCKHSLLTQIILTIFKLKYNLPDRTLELFFKIDHVTISRYVTRISKIIAELNICVSVPKCYTVDTTMIRIGRDKTKHTFSGYKHYHGLKYQMVINNHQEIISISNGIDSSIHDKKIFELEYTKVFNQLDTNLRIIGDKAYVGLESYRVITPFKHNEQRFKNNIQKAKSRNKRLSIERVRIEHVFGRLKTYRILAMPYYYAKSKLDVFVKAIGNIYNLIKTST